MKLSEFLVPEMKVPQLHSFHLGEKNSKMLKAARCNYNKI